MSRRILLYIWTISICLFKGCSAISCYQCSTNNELICNITQYVKPCPKYSQCMTMTFSLTKQMQNNFATKFKKKCVPRNTNCQDYCENLKDDTTTCLVSCCKGHKCNKAVRKEVIWYAKLTSADRKLTPYYITYLFLIFMGVVKLIL